MKSISIKLKKERAILSDTLPYETPITFSNRFFYDFLLSYKIEAVGDKIKWISKCPAIDNFIHIIFGISQAEQADIEQIDGFKQIRKKNGTFITIPFFYGVSHKEDSFRRLAVMHPRNQVQVVDFYNNYKEIIIYYSSRSNFSLRYPARVATTKLYDDERKSASVIIDTDIGDKYKDNKNLRSFFSYRTIRNIHEFFESKIYHDSEKKYNSMAQLDVSKCFDSIYTHSIAWAVSGKSFIKEQIAENSADILFSSFPDDFDTLMQKQNYNETNGILIGPELSRIFSEIIFQKIDLSVERELKNLDIYSGVDYEAFRYVDDYFIFYNENKVYKKIVSCLSSHLSEYKLGLNTEKEVIYEKPIITEVTIAKKKISDLIDDKVFFDIEIKNSEPEIKYGKIYIHTKSLITKYKMIISESGADYKSVNNFTLTIIESKIKGIIKKYLTVDNRDELENSMIAAFVSIVDFCFFIYSVSPRVNITIKLCRTLRELIYFCKSKLVNFEKKSVVFKVISDNIHFIVNKYESQIYTQVETLYLLTILSELGRDYWMDESKLVKYFGGVLEREGNYCFDSKLNYFSITSLLFYIKDKKRFKRVRKAIVRTIYSKITDKNTPKNKDTEILLLLLDCLSCPYLDIRFKRLLLNEYGIVDYALQQDMINLRKNWFTKWKDFQFGLELDSKQSESVY